MFPDKRYFGGNEQRLWFSINKTESGWWYDKQQFTDAASSRPVWNSCRLVTIELFVCVRALSNHRLQYSKTVRKNSYFEEKKNEKILNILNHIFL